MEKNPRSKISMLLSFPLHFRAIIKKTLSLLQPCLGKMVLAVQYSSDTTLFELYLGETQLTHLLSELECNEEFLSSYIPLPSSLWRVFSVLKGLLCKFIKSPISAFPS